MMVYLVEETIFLGERGLVVLLSEPVRTVPGYELHARIKLPDGEELDVQAKREFIRRTAPEPHEREAFLLSGLADGSVPVGSKIVFEPVPRWEKPE